MKQILLPTNDSPSTAGEAAAKWWTAAIRNPASNFPANSFAAMAASLHGGNAIPTEEQLGMIDTAIEEAVNDVLVWKKSQRRSRAGTPEVVLWTADDGKPRGLLLSIVDAWPIRSLIVWPVRTWMRVTLTSVQVKDTVGMEVPLEIWSNLAAA